MEGNTTSTSAVSSVIDVAMVFLPALGYVDQYITIRKTQVNQGFSLNVSLILVVSNVLRCFFWLRKPFEVALLFQSMFMVLVQFILLELCIRIRKVGTKRDDISDVFDLNKFWSWNSFRNYIFFTVLLVTTFAFLQLIMPATFELYGEGLGYAALLIESSLPFPQWNRNRIHKSTEGLSKPLIGTWFFGDILKIVYFVSKNSPFQFILCGLIQLSFDILILIQFITY